MTDWLNENKKMLHCIVSTYCNKHDSWANLVCLFQQECIVLPSYLIVLMPIWYCLRIVIECRLDTFWWNSQTIAYITRVTWNAAPSSYNGSTIWEPKPNWCVNYIDAYIHRCSAKQLLVLLTFTLFFSLPPLVTLLKYFIR